MAEPLSVGNVGDSLEEMLGTSQFTDWTTAGGGPSTLTSRQMRVITDKLDALDKWQKAHTGLDAWGAGPDYPHPSQKVRVLQFFEGRGRLDPSGIQFVRGSDLKGLHWVDELNDEPFSTYPNSSIYGQGGVISLLEMISSYSATEYAKLRVSASSLGIASAVLTASGGGETVTLSAIVSSSAGTKSISVDNAQFILSQETADFSPTSDGSLWYRTDLGKIRTEINGSVENLATESYVASAATNHVPYAAKTTTYTTTANDGVIAVDATAGSFTVTLVSAASNAGLTQTFKKTTAANVVTIDANTTQTIDGALTYALVARWSWVTLLSDGANWLITGAG